MLVTSHDSRKINQEYQEKMVSLVAGRVFRKVFLPAPIAAAYTVWRSIAFVWKGVRCLLHRKLEVEVLDALSITASLLRGDYSTAGSVMFLLTVLSAMRECGEYHITVKSGKYLEALAKADTIVFDKTGTLTRATPQVVQVVPFSGCEEQEVLQLAACLEEHFPHSMANAVVRAARERGMAEKRCHIVSHS